MRSLLLLSIVLSTNEAGSGQIPSADEGVHRVREPEGLRPYLSGTLCGVLLWTI